MSKRFHQFHRSLSSLRPLALALAVCATIFSTSLALSTDALADGPAKRDAVSKKAPVSRFVAKPPITGVVNINTATVKQLQKLPGVGPSKARRIVEYRKKRPFRRVRDLRRVKGIGRKTLAKMKGHLVVKGPSTVK